MGGYSRMLHIVFDSEPHYFVSLSAQNHNGLCYFKPLSDKKNDILDVKEADPQFPPNCLMPF